MQIAKLGAGTSFLPDRNAGLDRLRFLIFMLILLVHSPIDLGLLTHAGFLQPLLVSGWFGVQGFSP